MKEIFEHMKWPAVIAVISGLFVERFLADSPWAICIPILIGSAMVVLEEFFNISSRFRPEPVTFLEEKLKPTATMAVKGDGLK